MRQEELESGDAIGPLDWYKIHPFEAAAVSDRLEWVGLEAARYRATPAFEYDPPPLLTTCSSFMPGHRRNWTCAMRG